jgi:hypothetical protein
MDSPLVADAQDPRAGRLVAIGSDADLLWIGKETQVFVRWALCDAWFCTIAISQCGGWAANALSMQISPRATAEEAAAAVQLCGQSAASGSTAAAGI